MTDGSASAAPRNARPRVLVVVPAWNEQECVAAVVAEVREVLEGVDLVVVDDGSSDATAERALEAGAGVLSLPYHLGVGAAMRAGYRYAAENGYDVAVQVDADGQHDPRDVPRLVGALESCDLVIGARFAGKGAYDVSGPRRLAMRLLAWGASRITGTRLTDVSSGFRAANRAVIELFARDYPQEYLGDTVESLVIAARSGCRVHQLPVSMRARAGGAPSQSLWKSTAYLFRAVLVLVLAAIRRYDATSRAAVRRERVRP